MTLIKPLPYAPDSTALFRHLIQQPQPVLLHSADRTNRFGRFDILSAAPVTPVYFTADQADSTPVFQQLAQLIEQPANEVAIPNAPFTAGFLGAFNYPLHQRLEVQQVPPTDPVELPLIVGGIYDWSIVTDHGLQRTTLYTRNAGRTVQVLGWLGDEAPDATNVVVGSFTGSTSEAKYRESFTRIQEYLLSGDCYQVNLARHFSAKFSGHAWDLYRQWVALQPAPFGAYLGLPHSNGAILSFSPERFLKVRRGWAEVSPIKGTRPRRKDAEDDEFERDKLRSSHKDQAENLMIVDLLRNDLGRVCQPGTIQVPQLFEALRFSNVHHLVSTIRGKLQTGTSGLTAFKHLFPCGSVTGAPKIRAVDIINELEPVGRGIFCGSIGYFDVSGRVDSSVAIRTAVAQQGQVHLWGGGGIVADSQVDKELREIEHKIGRLMS